MSSSSPQLENSISVDLALPVTERSFFVRAGAGAGKTTKLIKTFYGFSKAFKEKHGQWPRVVLSTFTRKATQEIRERLVREALKLKDTEFLDYLNRRNLVQISTIHGLLQGLLNRAHDEIGFPSELSVIDDQTERLEIFKITKSRLMKEPLYSVLIENFKIFELVEVLQKLMRLKRQFPELEPMPENALEQDTRERAQAVAKEIRGILSEANSIEPSVYQKWEVYFAAMKGFADLLEKNQIQEAIRFIDTELPTKPKFLKAKPAFDPLLHERIAEWAEANKKGHFNFSDTTSFFETYKHVNRAFQHLLDQVSVDWLSQQKKKGFITIADMELLSLHAIRSAVSSAERFAREIDFIMLDEFQDTSPLQLEILRPLLKSTPHFIVGDPQQSIYLFRGARSEVFSETQAEAVSAKKKIEYLETNYRSAPHLLEFFNSFFANLGPQFSPMKAGRRSDEFSKSPLSDQARVQFLETTEQNLSCEAHIRSLLLAGVRLHDICILAPQQKSLASCVSWLRSRGIPTELQVAGGLERKREVIDLYAFLKFLVNPHDTENLFKLIRSPWFFVSDAELYHIVRKAKSKSLWVGLNEAQHSVCERLQFYQTSYRLEGVLATVFSFLKNERVIEWAYSLDENGRFESNLFKVIQNLEQESLRSGFSLNEFIERFGATYADLDSNSQSESPPADHKESVHAMTVHGSKGLQFKHVILLGCNREPNRRSFELFRFDEGTKKYLLKILDPETSGSVFHKLGQSLLEKLQSQEDDEYLRLLYVAMTRAEETLTLISESLEKVKGKSWRGRCAWPKPSVEENQSVEKTVLFLNHQVVSVRHDLEFIEKIKAQSFDRLILTSKTHSNSTAISASRPQVNSKDKIELSQFINRRPLEFLRLGKASAVTPQRRTLSVTSLLETEENSQVESSNANTLRSSELNGSQRFYNERLDDNRIVEAQMKAITGTRVHAILESLKFYFASESSPFTSDFGGSTHQTAEINFTKLPSGMQKTLSSSEKKAIQYLLKQKELPLLQILDRGYVEFGFKLKLDDLTFVQGQIDAWGIVNSNEGSHQKRTVYILDYKTGDTKYKNKAFDQLKIYANCLRHMNLILGEDQVQLAAIFPIEEKIFLENYKAESLTASPIPSKSTR